MKRLCIVLVVIASCCELVAAQDLPPDILADQYLLEATEALENGDVQNAVLAFQKIEELAIKPPLEYLFLYGKLLVEHRIFSHDELLKGQSLLKKYILRIKKDSEHYKPTLQLLSAVGPKLEAAKRIKIRLETLRADGVDLNTKDKDGYTPLYRAIRSDSLEVVKVLIVAGVDVNAKNNSGRTPLHFAAYTGTPEVVKVLIAAGADVNAKDKDELTPLHLAVYQDSRSRTPLYGVFGTPEVVKVLIAAGADVNAKSKGVPPKSWGGSTPLDRAVYRCTWSMKNRWNRKDEKPSPPLAEDTEVVKVLIAAGADVKDAGLLYRAVGNNYTEVVKAFIAAGADVNAEYQTVSILCGVLFGGSGMYPTPETSRRANVRALIAAGAGVNHPCGREQRPLDLVGKWELNDRKTEWIWHDWYPEIAAILRAAGAKSGKAKPRWRY